MRYYLLFKNETYYIQCGNTPTILEAAMFSTCTPVASIKAINEDIAMKFLMLRAIAHNRKIRKQNKI